MQVLELAESWVWPHGEKLVRAGQEHRGLKVRMMI
jgi:hypothetical protein